MTDAVRIQSEVEREVKAMQEIQRETQKLVESRQKLVEQQNEVALVSKEIHLLEDGANVFKLVGPVLVKQTLAEAKGTVDKRLEFINKELRKSEGLIKESETKQVNLRNKIVKLQETYYKAMTGRDAKQ